jgi:hypothetical protein
MAKTAMANVQETLPPALAAKMGSGRGTSTAQEDNLVPLIYVLQTNSPQVNKRDDRYVDGAEPGDIWLRNYGIVKGEAGLLFQPCYFEKDFVEWILRSSGGGFVGRHKEMPAEAKKAKDPQNPERAIFILPNGNEIKETRNHAGFVISEDGRQPLPYLIPLTSSGHTVSREWMGLMNRQVIPGTSTKPDSWSVYYRLRTKPRHNAKGDWFVLIAENAGPNGAPMWVKTEEDLDRGAAFFQAFATGAKQAMTPEESVDGAVQSAGDDDAVPF